MFFPLRTDIYLKGTKPVIFCWERPNVDISINPFRTGFREEQTSKLQKVYGDTLLDRALGNAKKISAQPRQTVRLFTVNPHVNQCTARQTVCLFTVNPHINQCTARQTVRLFIVTPHINQCTAPPNSPSIDSHSTHKSVHSPAKQSAYL